MQRIARMNGIASVHGQSARKRNLNATRPAMMICPKYSGRDNNDLLHTYGGKLSGYLSVKHD
ncbi:MAG TPA: hypothetical protein VK805_12980 [Candidatus Baltobacteraceae bacterium]|nr:hypothetical protein [Candidatus Baltobacteraceae bacterium]